MRGDRNDQVGECFVEVFVCVECFFFLLVLSVELDNLRSCGVVGGDGLSSWVHVGDEGFACYDSVFIWFDDQGQMY